jgi:hypothetical protein
MYLNCMQFEKVMWHSSVGILRRENSMLHGRGRYTLCSIMIFIKQREFVFKLI